MTQGVVVHSTAADGSFSAAGKAAWDAAHAASGLTTADSPTFAGIKLSVGAVTGVAVQLGAVNTGIYSRYSGAVNIAVQGSDTLEVSTLNGEGIKANSAAAFSWSSSGISGASDTYLSRLSGGVIGVGVSLGGITGTISAGAYVSGGSAGVDYGPGVVTSITIKKGIVTACS